VWWHWGGTAKESRPCVWGTHSETVAHAHTRGRPSSLHERERESYARDETRDQIPQRPTERAFPLLFVAAARRKFSGRGPQNACETKPGFAKAKQRPAAGTHKSVSPAGPAGRPASEPPGKRAIRSPHNYSSLSLFPSLTVTGRLVCIRLHTFSLSLCLSSPLHSIDWIHHKHRFPIL